jgi:enterochelin esterase-like enzyme
LKLAFGLVIWLAVAAPVATAGEFADAIARLQQMPQPWRPSLFDSLRQEIERRGTPICEDSLAHVLYLGTAGSVAIAGDMTGWKPTLPLQLIPVLEAGLWHLQLKLPLDARVDYKFVIDISSWQLDSLNPHTITGGFGPNSELAMPAYVQPPEIEDHGWPACRIETHENFESPQLGNARTLEVVTPPDYDPAVPRPVLIVHDGLEYITLASLPNVLAYLARMRPDLELPICVCIPPVDRQAEYAGDQLEAFGRFIVETVVPFVEARYAARAGDPRWWASMGASNGGNVSLYLAGAYPERFGGVIAMSPYVASRQHDLIAAAGGPAWRIYLNWGTYDLPQLIPGIESLLSLLREQGIAHRARAYHEGHSWGLWRATIDEGLEFLYAAASR